MLIQEIENLVEDLVNKQKQKFVEILVNNINLSLDNKKYLLYLDMKKKLKLYVDAKILLSKKKRFSSYNLDFDLSRIYELKEKIIVLRKDFKESEEKYKQLN